MGVRIRTTRESGPYPRPVITTFECDVGSAFFCRGFVDIKVGKKPIDPIKRIHQLGWKESPTGFFQCPECQKK